MVWRYADVAKNDPSLDIESHVKAYLQTHQARRAPASVRAGVACARAAVTRRRGRDVILERAVTNAMCLVMRPLAENAAPPLYGFARVPLKSREQESSDGGEAKEEGANINEYKYTDATKVRRSLARCACARRPGPRETRFSACAARWCRTTRGSSRSSATGRRTGGRSRAPATTTLTRSRSQRGNELVFVQTTRRPKLWCGPGSSARTHARGDLSALIARSVRRSTSTCAPRTIRAAGGHGDKLVNATVSRPWRPAAQGWRQAVMWPRPLARRRPRHALHLPVPPLRPGTLTAGIPCRRRAREDPLRHGGHLAVVRASRAARGVGSAAAAERAPAERVGDRTISIR